MLWGWSAEPRQGEIKLKMKAKDRICEEGRGDRRGGTQQHLTGTSLNRTEKNKTARAFFIAFPYPDLFLNSEAE